VKVNDLDVTSLGFEAIADLDMLIASEDSEEPDEL
jgi:hypothetical protein